MSDPAPATDAVQQPSAALPPGRIRPNRLRLNGPVLAVAIWAFYSAGMAVAWLVADHQYSDSVGLLRDTWWVIGILAAATLVLARLSGLRVLWSNRVAPLGLLLVVPVVLLSLGALLTLAAGGEDWGSIAFVTIGCIFVGIGEETAFRGIALNALAERVPVLPAVLGSSILFGLMHSVNVMLQGASTTLVQVIITAIVGLIFGWTYVFSGGNLWLVIVLHALYDWSLIAPMATDEQSNPIAGIIPLILYPAAILLTVIGAIRYADTPWIDIAGRRRAKRVGAADGSSV